MDTIQKVYAYIQEKSLIPANTTVILGVSGGLDSMVMAHILLSLQAQLDFSPVIANFNHHLRPEAAEEGKFVASFAAEKGIPFYQGEADIAMLSQGRNVEEVARTARYHFLREVAARYPNSLIATAHHQGDQAETVLLHLLRGCGLTGLCGIYPVSNGLIRPLLCLSQEEIEEFGKNHQVDFRQDESNFSWQYLRNRVRLSLLPQLQAYNPRIIQSLTLTAALCQEDEALLEQQAEEAFSSLWQETEHSLALKELKTLPLALQRRVLRKAYGQVNAAGGELDYLHVAGILALKDEQEMALPGELVVYCRERLFFGKEKPPLPICPETCPLLTDGLWHPLSDWGWMYQATFVSTPNWEKGAFLLPVTQAKTAYWRTRRLGDVIPSMGKSNKRKVKDLFIRRHIPQWQRNTWPILVWGEEIVWIPMLWHGKNELDRNKHYILIKIRRCDKI